MSNECKLSFKFYARIRLAIDKFIANKFEFMITIGCDYRKG